MACLNPIFTSHMVFAARKPIRVYGSGQGSVEVTFAGNTRKTVSSEEGWMVEFPPMEYGGPYTLSARFDGEEVLLDDLFVGEVYLMSGQSNMQFKLSESNTPPSRICADPRMRLFTAPRLEEGEPYTPADGWVVCTAENAPRWSALAYLVGQMRSSSQNVAVGLIACYQGASIIESWLPEGTLDSLGISPEQDASKVESRHKWNEDGILYRESLSHVFPFSLSAVVWYQGESNWFLEKSRHYKSELTELIRVWRQVFRDEQLPFAVVQIANYGPRLGEGWSNIQTAQYEIQFEVPGVKTVISSDISETDDIHPPTKFPLAVRIVKALSELL